MPVPSAFADQDPEEGTPADEADVESKSNALESAIWRLTAGKGDRGPLRKNGSGASGETDPGVKAGEPTFERTTAAGRVDFVLQVSPLPLKSLLLLLHLRGCHCCHCYSQCDCQIFAVSAVAAMQWMSSSS